MFPFLVPHNRDRRKQHWEDTLSPVDLCRTLLLEANEGLEGQEVHSISCSKFLYKITKRKDWFFVLLYSPCYQCQL